MDVRASGSGPGTPARFGRYFITGVTVTCLDFVVFNVGLACGLPVVPANVVGISSAIALSFTLNMTWTFGDRGGNWQRQGLPYLMVCLVALGSHTLIVHALTPLMAALGLAERVAPNAAKVVATGVLMTFNYLAFDLLVFKRRRAAV